MELLLLQVRLIDMGRRYSWQNDLEVNRGMGRRGCYCTNVLLLLHCRRLLGKRIYTARRERRVIGWDITWHRRHSL